MGFFSGRVAFQRFRVLNKPPRQFGPDHLDRLSGQMIGKQRVASSDGVEAGWIAGDHILDTRFDLAKNIVNDTMHFALRMDKNKIPGDLLRAYTAIELEGMAAANPSGMPSQKQRKEARMQARDKLEKELADGRYLQRKMYPLLWDCQSGELLVGTTSKGAIDRMITLFQQTFGHGLEALSAGVRAYRLAEARERGRNVEDAEPSSFLPNVKLPVMSWAPDEASRDFLGNEFLLWLWYVLDAEADTIVLEDKSEVAVMLARSLTLECPRGQTGRESIQSDAPGRLPEARQAIRAGKLPRKAGLTLVRHEQQYELTLAAETLAVAAGKLPAPENVEEERTRLEERVGQLRDLLETLDLLYDAFGQRRFGPDWAKELSKIRKWMHKEE